MLNGPVVKVENLFVKYGQHEVLENVNMEIREKEIVSIVGPNGSGKSTLLKAILGFKEAYQGKIEVMGYSPKEIHKKKLAAYLSQTNHADDNFPVTVFDVVAMSRYSRKSFFERLTAEDKTIIEESLEKVEMADFGSRHFGSLSGGQKQRVLIARVLAGKPKILFMDEPSTGLDVISQYDFYCLLKKLRDEENMSVLMVSHDIGMVSSLVDRIALLNKTIHFYGEPRTRISGNILEKVFGRDMNILVHDERCLACHKEKS